MNIFVAGGAGFIGSHLCDALLKKGNTVIVADKLIMGKQNIEHLMHNPNFKFYEVELANQNNVDTIFDENKIDAIWQPTRIFRRAARNRRLISMTHFLLRE